MTDQELMQSIKTKWGSLFDSVAAQAPAPPAAFFAALTANETGGNPLATRQEPAVLAALHAVLMNRKPAYGSIGRADILGYAQQITATLNMQLVVAIDQLSTSYGLVQIMGYEAIPYNLKGALVLQDPASELVVALKMLRDFATRSQLDLASDFSELFDCWNTGRPHAPTFDPAYIPNGLQRMQVYQALP